MDVSDIEIDEEALLGLTSANETKAKKVTKVQYDSSDILGLGAVVTLQNIDKKKSAPTGCFLKIVLDLMPPTDKYPGPDGYYSARGAEPVCTLSSATMLMGKVITNIYKGFFKLDKQSAPCFHADVGKLVTLAATGGNSCENIRHRHKKYLEIISDERFRGKPEKYYSPPYLLDHMFFLYRRCDGDTVVKPDPRTFSRDMMHCVMHMIKLLLCHNCDEMTEMFSQNIYTPYKPLDLVIEHYGNIAKPHSVYQQMSDCMSWGPRNIDLVQMMRDYLTRSPNIEF